MSSPIVRDNKWSDCSHDAVIRVYDDAGNVIERVENTRPISQSREFFAMSRHDDIELIRPHRVVAWEGHNAGKEQTNAKIPVSRILYGARFEGGAPRGGLETP
jgi:hypothetical protein